MHVAIIGTYPPTRCGIATFTADVEISLVELGVEVTIVAVDADECSDDPAATAGPSITSALPESYEAAAKWLNRSDVDVVLVQHEFGIHGGVDGAALLQLTRRLTVPYVVTLHTVLPHFSPSQAHVLQELCARAAAVTVFTSTARRLVLEQELVAARRLRIVPHGAPVELYRPADVPTTRRELGLPAHGPVLSTFGLLSAGKGLELTIRSLPALIAQWPELRYVIAGRTHPGVVRHEGERYREGLHALAQELGVTEHVVFLDRFLSIGEVANVLAVTDVFCTPYRNEDQIVSGALTFALAAGCPVVSTPYLYAADMLAGGAGTIVPLGDAVAFAGALRSVLLDGTRRDAALAAAKHLSASLSWPSVARTLRHVLDESMHPAEGGLPLLNDADRILADQNDADRILAGRTTLREGVRSR